MTEREYIICPLSNVRETKQTSEDFLLSQGLSLEHEFEASIKQPNGYYIETVIHIRGNLNSEWLKKISENQKFKRDLIMPLYIEGDKYFAGFSTMTF